MTPQTVQPKAILNADHAQELDSVGCRDLRAGQAEQSKKVEELQALLGMKGTRLFHLSYQPRGLISRVKRDLTNNRKQCTLCS